MRKILINIVGFILLFSLLYFIYFVSPKIFYAISTINPAIATILYPVFGSIAIATITILISRHYEQKAKIDNDMRNKKIPIYENIISFVFSLVYYEKIEGKPINEIDLIKQLSIITQNLMIWGSDEVVKSFSDLRIGMAKGEIGTTIKLMGIFFLAIRKDLGHKNKNLHESAILRLFLNDIQDRT